MITRDSIQTKHINADQVITRAAYPLASCRGCKHAEKFRGKGCGVLREYQSPCFVKELGEKRGREEEEWEW